MPLLQLFDKASLNRIHIRVVAIGSPLSLRNSVTVGVVSNTRRAGRDIGVQSVDPQMEYIQVDAAVKCVLR